jgi:hypothetical protein
MDLYVTESFGIFEDRLSDKSTSNRSWNNVIRDFEREKPLY